MMNMEIKSITMNSGCVDILVDTKSNKKRVFVAKLNDFDEFFKSTHNQYLTKEV